MEIKAGYSRKTLVLESLLMVVWIVFLSLPLSPVYSEPGDDIELFRYVGMLISKGYLPYVDVFDNKSPLIYILNWLMLPFGVWGAWLLSTALLTVTSLLLLVVLKFKKTEFAFLYIALFALLMRFPPLIMGGGLTREYSTLFIALLLICYYLPPSKFKIGVSGFITGLILLIQPNDVLCAIPFAGLVFLEMKKTGYGIARFSVFFSIPVLAIIAWLLYQNNFDDMLNRIFRDNTTQYISNGPGIFKKISRTVIGLWTHRLLIPVVIVTGFLIKNIFETPGKKAFQACFSGIILSLINVSVSGRALGHYYLPLIPFLIWALILIFEQAQFHNYSKAVSLSFLMTAWFSVDTFLIYIESKPFEANNSYINCFSGQLAGEPINDNDLLVFCQSGLLSLNTLREVKSPAKWAIQPDFHLPFSAERKRKVLNDVVLSAKENRTKWIIDGTAENKLGAEEFVDTWQNFLTGNYLLIDSALLYKQRHYTYLYKIKQ